jgi:hypothetical protein
MVAVMTETREVIEGWLPKDLFLGFYRVAYAPVPYRAIERGDRRYAWTLPARRRPTAAGTMAPPVYALVLVRGGTDEWVVEELKGFDDVADAERWARALARDADTPGSG